MLTILESLHQFHFCTFANQFHHFCTFAKMSIYYCTFANQFHFSPFRDSLRGLTRVFDEGYVCGRVGSGGLTIIDGKTKLCRVSKPFGNYLIFC